MGSKFLGIEGKESISFLGIDKKNNAVFINGTNLDNDTKLKAKGVLCEGKEAGLTNYFNLRNKAKYLTPGQVKQGLEKVKETGLNIESKASVLTAFEEATTAFSQGSKRNFLGMKPK